MANANANGSVFENERIPVTEVTEVESAGGQQQGAAMSRADLASSYLATRFYGYLAALEALPHALDDLTKEFGIDVYERMTTDSEVAATLDIVALASCAFGVRFAPVVDDTSDPDNAAARFIAQWFGEMWDGMSQSPTSALQQLVKNALAFGSGVGELKYRIDADNSIGAALVIDKIEPKKTKDSSFVVDAFNNVAGIVPTRVPTMRMPIGGMIPVGDGKVKLLDGMIPRSKFLVLSWDAVGGDPRGRSVLRSAYTAWWIKQQAISEMLEFLARFSQPSIVGIAPESAQRTCEIDPETGLEIPGTVHDPIMDLLQALQKFRSGGAGAFPYGTNVFPIDLSASGQIFLMILDYADRSITRAILKQHLATAEGEHQARAAADNHQKILSLLVIFIKRWVAEAIRSDILQPLTEANFGAEYMHLTPKVDLGDGDGFPITPAEVASLMAVGYFTPDQLPIIDKQLGLPVRESRGRY